MKKIKYFFVSVIVFLLVPVMVNAASGKISVSGPSQAVVGNTVTYTVNLTSSVGIGSWEMDLEYNKSYLQLTYTNSEGGGTAMVGYASSDAGTKSVKYTFKFKVLKTGNTSVTIPSYDVYAADMSRMTITSSGRTTKLITQQQLQESYSKNNDLASLSVEGFELTPAFSKDTLEYSVTIPEGTKEINIIAKASDSKSTVSGVGTQAVTEGTNSFPIVVKAENGSEKTYTLKVEVKDEHPINVKVDNKNYTIVKLKENLPKADMYEEYTLKINDIDIPAYKNNNTKLVLVGLKDDAGKVSLFIYDEKTKEYKPYYEIGVNKNTIYPLPLKDDLSFYDKGEIDINGIKVNAYYVTKDSRFAIIYGINVETGEETYFEYDKNTQTIMKYNDELIRDLSKKIDLYTYIIIGFLAVFLVMFIIMFSLLKKNKKKKKKEKTILDDDTLLEKEKMKRKKNKGSKD